jgi:hypothetical protein
LESADRAAFACNLQAYEKHTTSVPSSASRPKGPTDPASDESAYRVPAGLQPDSRAHDFQDFQAGTENHDQRVEILGDEPCFYTALRVCGACLEPE